MRNLMNAKGLRSVYGKPLSPFRYQFMLRNLFYCGLFVLKGEMHEGAHEPLVSKETFDKVQEIMKRRTKPTSPRLKSYVYRGLFRCSECSAGITMETQKGHNYLPCTKRVKKDCSQPYVREQVMTGQIAAALQSVSLPDETADWMLSQLNTEHAEAERLADEARSQLLASITKANQKLDRLTAAYLDDGAFSASEFRQRKQDVLSSKRKLMDTLMVLNGDQQRRFEPVKRFVNGSKQMKYLAESQNPKEMRAKLQEIGSNLTIRDRCLHWQPRGAWQLVVDQGSFAQRTTAPAIAGAVVVGETHQTSTKWSHGESNPDLLNAIQPSSR